MCGRRQHTIWIPKLRTVEAKLPQLDQLFDDPPVNIKKPMAQHTWNVKVGAKASVPEFTREPPMPYNLLPSASKRHKSLDLSNRHKSLDRECNRRIAISRSAVASAGEDVVAAAPTISAVVTKQSLPTSTTRSARSTPKRSSTHR